MKTLKFYLCQRRHDLMTEEEVDDAPEYDIYRGYIIVATSIEEALYNCPRRQDVIRDGSIEDLLECGLPVLDDEHTAYLATGATPCQEMGRVKWSAKAIGMADMSQFSLLDIVMSDHKNG